MTKSPSLANMTKTPVTIKDAHGVDHELHPLTLGDLGKLERWAREFPIAEAKRMTEKFTDTLNDEQKARMIDEAITKSGAITSVLTQEAGELLATMQGVLYSALLALQHSEPDVTEAIVGDLFEVNGIDDLMAKLDTAAGLRELEGNQGSPKTAG